MTSDIDELLEDLRKREEQYRKAAEDTPPMFPIDKRMAANGADQHLRWIAAVEELRTQASLLDSNDVTAKPSCVLSFNDPEPE